MENGNGDRPGVPAERKNLPDIAFDPKGGIMLRDFDQLMRFANIVAAAKLAGVTSPQEAVVLVQTGMELGLTPMQSTQALSIYKGRINIPVKTGLALVRKSGLLESITEWREGTIEGGDMVAYCKARRKGDAEDTIFRYGIADAKRAGLWGKTHANGPSPWVTNPERMMRARARGWMLDDLFGDVLTGLAYTEEMDEYIDVTARAADAPADSAPPPVDTLTAAAIKLRNKRQRVTVCDLAAEPDPGPGTSAQSAPAEAPAPAESAEDALPWEDTPGPGAAPDTAQTAPAALDPDQLF